jgi:hypothetical protein
MSGRRGTTQYNDGCRAFVAFAVSNCTTSDGKILCPCRYCRNNQHHYPDYVLAHLTRGVKACLCCMYSTRSIYLKNDKKFCYMGHMRYLPTEHLWQLNKEHLTVLKN